MADEIKPAMTPEQWKQARRYPPGVVYGFSGEDEGVMDRHRMAALCLYGQPFGFTREDVAQLHDWAYGCEEYGDRRSVPILRSLAARIAALLPPEAP